MIHNYTKISIFDNKDGKENIIHVNLSSEQLREILNDNIVNITNDEEQEMTSPSTPNNHPETIFIRSGYKHKGIKVKDIISIEANRSYCIINLLNGEQLKITSPMNKVLEDLDSRLFKRIHRSFCVNVDHIRSIEPTSILLDNHIRVNIGRKYLNVLDKEFVFLGSRRKIIHKRDNHSDEQ